MRRPDPKTRGTAVRLVTLAVLVLTQTGCMRGCKSSRPPFHPNPSMDYQPRYESQTESDFFYDGRTMRLPVPGTVAYGEVREDDSFYTGKDGDGNFLTANPLPVNEELLARGRQRYTIYCQPCHDKRGLGRGILFEYGNVPTASFHDEQRLAYPDGRIFDVITNGSGLMQSYRYPVTAKDRWAIVAWIRKMQQDRLATRLASSRP